jgi:NAD(P)-dependent dehydrogenase (short-subunit alcohol dehydrogenase family)
MKERVFITGGGSGLGKALAERYAKAGWSVAVGDIHDDNGKAVAQSVGGQFLKCDVRKVEDLEAAAQWLVTHWGGVDVVINNAGVAGAGKVTQYPLEDWQWLLDINVMGVVRGCKVFAPILEKQGKGAIVNIASIAGLVHPPTMSAYNATKAAVVALSESLHFELAKKGVHVAVVCPGFFRSNLHDTMRVSDPRFVDTARKLVAEAKTEAPAIADKIFQGVQRREFKILPCNQSR